MSGPPAGGAPERARGSDAKARAAALPRHRRPDDGHAPPPVLVGWLMLAGMGVGTMAIPALALGLAHGLVALAVAVPVFAGVILSARWLRGFAVASIGVEPDGTVRVISGPRAIVEAQRSLGDPRRWLRGEVIKGLLLLIPIIGLPTAASVLLDTPLPMMAFCVVVGLLLLSCSRHLLLAAVWRARTGGEILDAGIVSYQLAVFGRHRGLDAVIAGVPADELAAVLREHPGEARNADVAAASSTVLGRAAQDVSAASGRSRLP